MPLAFLVLHALRAFEHVTRGLSNVGRFLGCGKRALFAVAPSGQHAHRESRALFDASLSRYAFEAFASFGRFARALRLQQADVFALHGLVHGAH